MSRRGQAFHQVECSRRTTDTSSRQDLSNHHLQLAGGVAVSLVEFIKLGPVAGRLGKRQGTSAWTGEVVHGEFLFSPMLN